MQPYSRASMVSAFSNRVLSPNDALGLSKSSVENFPKHPQTIFVRRLMSRVMSASSEMRTPRYTDWCTWWYFWPAAAISSAGRGGVGVSPGCYAFFGARVKRIFVFFSDTVKPNAPNISTITVIIFASLAGDLDTILASSAYSIPHTVLRTRSSSVSSGPPPLPSSRNIENGVVFTETL